jgi:hypothetical protein
MEERLPQNFAKVEFEPKWLHSGTEVVDLLIPVFYLALTVQFQRVYVQVAVREDRGERHQRYVLNLQYNLRTRRIQNAHRPNEKRRRIHRPKVGWSLTKELRCSLHIVLETQKRISGSQFTEKAAVLDQQFPFPQFHGEVILF